MALQKDPYEDRVALALGDAMRTLRERRGLRREHLGLVLGCTVRTVRSYEEGRRRVSLADFLRICSALAVQAETFLVQLPPPPRIVPMAAISEDGIGPLKRRKQK